MTTEQYKDGGEESIIRKIQKLFDMAKRTRNNDGTSNENQASAAMAKAQELLAKYNLQVHQVEDARIKTGVNAEVEAVREKKKINKSAMYEWSQRLWRTLAEANFCFHWVSEVSEPYNKVDKWTGQKVEKHRYVKRHFVLGREENVIAVEAMGEYLCETIEDLLPYPNNERLSTSAVSWREGCADRLIRRITEQAERAKSEGIPATPENSTASTAIVVRSTYDAEYQANYDFKQGRKGAYAEMQERHAKWDLEWKARQDAIRLAREQETPEQRAARLKAEAKQAEKDARRSERYWDAQQRQQDRKDARKDWNAYHRGGEAGKTINLDKQVKD